MTRSLALLAVVSSLAACSSSSSSTTGSTTGASTGATVGSTSGTTSGASNTATTGAATTGAATTSGAVSGTTGTGSTGTTTGAAGSSTGGTTGTLTAQAFAAAFNETYCNFALTCDNYASYAFSYCTQGTVFLYDAATAAEAVDAGRVSFDPIKAATCLNAFPDAGCSNLALETLFTTVCLPALKGQLPSDAGCVSSADCLSGSCSSSDCTPGLCAPMSEAGDACNCMGAGCGVCDPAGDLQCISNVCVAPLHLGATCSESTASCGEGLDCINGTCTSVPVAVGGPCAPHGSDCVAGSYCLTAVGAMTGSCVATSAAGQPCSQDAEHFPNAISTSNSQCITPGDVCLGAGVLVDGGIASGICTVASDEGGPCSPPASVIDAGVSYVTGCKTGLNCVSGTCTRPPSSGTCSPLQNPCDFTLAYCSSSTNTCETPVAVGGDCTSAQCANDTYCEANNVCASDCTGAL